MKKHVLIFSTAYYPFVGGAEIAIKEITDRLSSQYEFDLITARFDKKLPAMETIGAVTIHRIGTGRPVADKLMLPFFGAFKAAQLHAEKNFFCLWGMMATFGSGAGYIFNIARFLSRKKKIPMVLTLQEGDSDAHLRFRWAGLISLSWKLALKQTDMVIAISNFLLHRAERYGYDGKRVLIPNGVDTKLFSHIPTQEEKELMIKKLGKKPDDVFLVTTSRLTKKNAVDDIISALTYLPETISLIVIGTGEEGVHLQALAHSLGVVDRVKFLGFLPHQDIAAYLSVCDIFVRPSRSEGFGNSFIEAMAARLPVIATPVGGIVDFIDDKETGLFCAPDNPPSLADAVLQLLDDTSLSERIVRQGFERVSQRYDWNTVAQEMKEYVFDVL